MSKSKGVAPAFTIWDARYPFDPDRALVMSCCQTLDEAKNEAPDYGIGAVVTDSEGRIVYTVPPAPRRGKGAGR